jgi:hypothetical protein
MTGLHKCMERANAAYLAIASSCVSVVIVWVFWP